MASVWPVVNTAISDGVIAAMSWVSSAVIWLDNKAIVCSEVSTAVCVGVNATICAVLSAGI